LKTREIHKENKYFEDLLFDLGSRIKIMLADALLNQYNIERVFIELKETLRKFRKEYDLIPKKLIP